MEASRATPAAALPATGARQLAGDLLALTKPKVQSLLLLTTVTTMYVAGDPSMGLVFLTCLGGAVSAGGAGAPGPDAPAPGSLRAPLDPQTLSCNDLKAQMKSSGELNLLVGPRNGWGDTFYGPAVPRCQFYQMPQFAYVKAQDGRCGIGYICIDKMSID